MKKHYKSITAVAAFAMLASAGVSQAQPTPAPTPARPASESPAVKPGTPAPTQIVFVPKKMLEENKEAGKLKENTFYWTNIPDDANQGPKVAQEDEKPVLLLKGAGTETTTKSMTIVTLVRAFNIPENAKSATISYEIKQGYDEWIDKNIADKSLPALSYSFFRNGKEARKDTKLPLPSRQDKEWKTVNQKTDLPAGAQQLVIVARTDFPTSLSFSALDVTFD